MRCRSRWTCRTGCEFGAGADGSYEDLLARRQRCGARGLRRASGATTRCLILYTGGTTGESKGALHSHRSMSLGMLNQTVAERIVPTDVYMLTGQMFHIPVGARDELHAPRLPAGADELRGRRQALELIQAEQVSAFLGITTMLNWMMAVEDSPRYDLSSLRNIQYGGGPMPVTVIRAALDMFPCTLIQGYGQTEGMTMTFLSQEDHAGAHPRRSPRAAALLRARGLRDQRAGGRTRMAGRCPATAQAAGEIVVRSEANMLGYWRRPGPDAADDARRLDVDRRHRDLGRRRLRLHRRPRQGHDHLRRREHLLDPGRERDPSPSRRCSSARSSASRTTEWGEVVKAVVVLKPGMHATEREIIDEARKHLASYQKPQLGRSSSTPCPRRRPARSSSANCASCTRGSERWAAC